MIICNNDNEARNTAKSILGGSIYYNAEKSVKAGYTIYDSDEGGWISDLGNVIEVNHKNGQTTRIHIVEKMSCESTLENLFSVMDKMPWSEYKNLCRDAKVFYDHLHEELKKTLSKEANASKESKESK